MKVIQQLIAHFKQRGLIQTDHIVQFVARGYWGFRSNEELRQQRNVGDSFYFQVVGTLTGPVWGTDVYTSDSHLGAACVHAGLIAENESAVVKVTMVNPPSLFPGSTRNGITSRNYGSWPAAYEIELVYKDNGG